MKFKFPFFAKKENVPIIPDRSINPELFNGSYFYPINIYSQQNNSALLKMYEDLPEIASPVNYLIDKSSDIPLVHERLNGDKWEKIDKSDVLKVLNDPNPHSNESLYRRQWGLNYVMFGNAYQNKVVSVGFGKPSQIFILPSAKTEPKLNDQKDYRLQEIIAYETKMNGVVLRLPVDEVEHTRQAGLNDEWYYKGRSQLMTAILTSESLRYNYEARVSIYKARGAMVIITPKGEQVVLNPDDQDALIKKYNEKFGIMTGKSPVMAGSVPMDVSNISPDIKGLMLNENKLQDMQTIAALLKVPSVLLNDNKSSTYNNMSTAEKTFYTNASMPFNRSFCESLRGVFSLPDNERIRADYSGVEALQADLKLKVEVTSKEWEDNQITSNEYRQAMGRSEVPGGDKRKNEIESEAGPTIEEPQED